MKLLSFIIFLLITTSITGQAFKKDWITFYNRYWNVIYSNDNTQYIHKTTQGQIIFQNKNDTALNLIYYVYLKSDIDTDFCKKIMNWQLIQSCITITNGKSDFMSFDYGDYFYFLQPCHSCHTGKNDECEKLADQLIKFIPVK